MEGNGRVPACWSNREAEIVPTNQKDASVPRGSPGETAVTLRSR